MDPTHERRSRRLLRTIVLVVVGPALGLAALDTGFYLGIGGLCFAAFGVVWGAVSYHLVQRPGWPRWKALAAALSSVAWTCISIGMLFVVAIGTGAH
jgi:hypothetical protein